MATNIKLAASLTSSGTSEAKRPDAWTAGPQTAILRARVTGANAVSLAANNTETTTAVVIPADGKTYIYGPYKAEDRPWFRFGSVSTVVYAWETVESEA